MKTIISLSVATKKPVPVAKKAPPKRAAPKHVTLEKDPNLGKKCVIALDGQVVAAGTITKVTSTGIAKGMGNVQENKVFVVSLPKGTLSIPVSSSLSRPFRTVAGGIYINISDFTVDYKKKSSTGAPSQ